MYVDEGISGATIDGRPHFKRLLKDIADNIINIILVEDHDRLSRSDDSREYSGIIEILKEKNIELWSRIGGFCDLSSFGGKLTAMLKFLLAEEERKQIAQRLTRGRRSKMKEGIPLYSKRLYGRKIIVNKKTGEIAWEIDKAKINKVRRAGKLIIDKRYGWRKAAEEVGMSWSTLRHTILNSAGKTFKQRNAIKMLNIDETYTFEIPKHARIFDEKTLTQIRQVNKENTISHGPYPKNPMLLNRILRLEENEMSFQANRKKDGRRYYAYRGDRANPKQPSFYVPAEKIEIAVMDVIAECISNSSLFKDAVYGGKEQTDQRKVIKRDLDNLKEELKQNKLSINRIIGMVAAEMVTMNDVQINLKKYKNKQKKINKALKLKKEELENLPSPEKIESIRQSINQSIRSNSKPVPTPDLTNEVEQIQFKRAIKNLDFDKKKDLLLKLFSGKDHNGKRYAIYVEKNNGGFDFFIYANLGFFAIGTLDKDGRYEYNPISYGNDSKMFVTTTT